MGECGYDHECESGSEFKWECNMIVNINQKRLNNYTNISVRTSFKIDPIEGRKINVNIDKYYYDFEQYIENVTVRMIMSNNTSNLPIFRAP